MNPDSILRYYPAMERGTHANTTTHERREHAMNLDDEAILRRRLAMVELLESTYGVRDARILDAMRKIPRHRFIPESLRSLADPYGNHPCPIGRNQTISQPFIVAHMTERLGLQAGERLLEIGTGSGYQAAILAELRVDVFSVEIVPELARDAETTLKSLGYAISLRIGDGYEGWPDRAPFDAILVTCSPTQIPDALVDQLADNGRMILPLNEGGFETLVILQKSNGQVRRHDDIAVRFVPMVHGHAPA